MYETMFQLDQRKQITNPNCFPYCSIGVIQACYDNEKHYAVGTIIGINKVITCVTNLIASQTNSIAADLLFAFPKDSDFRKVKVKHVTLMKNVKVSKQDLQKHSQNIAILELEQNIGSEGKFVDVFWDNQVKPDDQITLVGYTFFDFDNNNGFQMAQQNIKVVSRKNNLLQYKAYTEKGYSGAPLLLLRQKKYEIVGIHSGINKQTQRHEGIIFDSQIKQKFE